jgi:hypothetical protein
MELEWFAMDSETPNLRYPQRSGVEDYVSRIDELIARGEGYSEVSVVDQEYPYLALSFRNGFGIVHQFLSEDNVYLLLGDGVVGDDEEVSVLELEGDSRFTGRLSHVSIAPGTS